MLKTLQGTCLSKRLMLALLAVIVAAGTWLCCTAFRHVGVEAPGHPTVPPARETALVTPGISTLPAHNATAMGKAEDAVPAKGEESRRTDPLPLATGTVSGKVTYEDTGEPVAGIEVRASEGAPQVTDNQGRYRLRGLPRGNHEIRCILPAGQAVARHEFPGGQVGLLREAEVEERSETPNVDFQLERATSIEGRVRFPNGQGTRSATVAVTEWFRPVAESSSGPVNAAVAMKARSGPGGRYRIEGIPQGAECTVVATAANCSLASRQVVLAPHEGASDIDFELRRPATATGQVVDTDGQPMTAVKLQLEPADDPTGAVQAVTDTHGCFTLPQVPEGRYQFAVVDDTQDVPAVYETVSAAVQLEAGRSLEGCKVVVKTLAFCNGFVQGQVRDTAGRPLARIRVQAQDPTRLVEATSDESGRFRIDGLRAKTVSLAFDGDSRVRAVLADIPVGSTDVDVALGGLGSIAGIVRDADTRLPVDQAEVMVLKEGAPTATGLELLDEKGLPTKTGEEGAFTLQGICEGTVTIAVHAPNHPTVTLPGIPVEPAHETRIIDIELPAT